MFIYLTMLRKYLGNILGFIIYHIYGKKILLKNFNENNILSIYFHNPSKIVFKAIVKWLVFNDFEIISLDTFKTYFDDKRCVNKRTAFISFDDAWADNLELSSFLIKNNVPITLFVATEPIEIGQLWLNIVRDNFSEIPKNIRENINISDLKNISHNKAFALYEIVKLKHIDRKIMTKEQLLVYSKICDVGSHSITHPILTNCEDKVIMNELLNSENKLKAWGIEVKESFAYPNGSFNEKVIKLIKESNYEYAFTTQPNIINFNHYIDNHSIPRICIPDQLGFYENLARMSSIWTKLFK